MNRQRMLRNRIPVSTLQELNPKNDPNNEKVPTIYKNTTHFNILFYPWLDFPRNILWNISTDTFSKTMSICQSNLPSKSLQTTALYLSLALTKSNTSSKFRRFISNPLGWREARPTQIFTGTPQLRSIFLDLKPKTSEINREIQQKIHFTHLT